MRQGMLSYAQRHKGVHAKLVNAGLTPLLAMHSLALSNARVYMRALYAPRRLSKTEHAYLAKEIGIDGSARGKRSEVQNSMQQMAPAPSDGQFCSKQCRETEGMLACSKKFCMAISAAVTMREVLRWEKFSRLEPLCTMNTVEIMSASWSTCVHSARKPVRVSHETTINQVSCRLDACKPVVNTIVFAISLYPPDCTLCSMCNTAQRFLS